LIRVAIDHQIFGIQRFGGISRAFTRLVEELERLDDVRVVLPFPFANSIYVERSRAFRFQRALQRVGFRPSISAVRDFGRAVDERLERALLARARFDVFQPTNFRDYWSDLLGDRPFVLWVPDMIPELFPESFATSPHEDKMTLLPRAAAVVAISETTRADLLRLAGIAPERVSVATLGPPFEAPPSGAAPPAPDEYVLFVGKRPGYKNFDRFAAAMRRSMRRRPALHLVCVGGGQLRERERSAFAEAGCLDRVHVRKVDDDQLQWLYRKARLFVFPSWYEGFGLPVLEAFASACPAAIADTAVFREVAGDAAAFFDPNDEDAIHAAIERLLDDDALRRDLAGRGAQRLRDFSWRAMAAHCAAVYRAVASESSRARRS
jgi:glycosyltransferase involved in cell wall biosynthesis